MLGLFQSVNLTQCCVLAACLYAMVSFLGFGKRALKVEGQVGLLHSILCVARKSHLPDTLSRLESTSTLLADLLVLACLSLANSRPEEPTLPLSPAVSLSWMLQSKTSRSVLYS